MTFLDRIKPKPVAYWLIFSGVLSTALLFDVVRAMPPGSPRLVLGIPLFVYLLTVLGGFLLLRKSRAGLWLVIASQVAQAPVIAVPQFAYAMLHPGSLELQLLPRTGFSFATEVHFDFRWARSDSEWQISFNLLALALAVWACDRLDDLSIQPATAG